MFNWQKLPASMYITVMYKRNKEVYLIVDLQVLLNLYQGKIWAIGKSPKILLQRV
jgi:hypothetical protein